MHTAPSSPKAKYLWEAFNHAKEYASEARDRTSPPLPMEAESTAKSHYHEACDSPTTPITPATHHHSPSPEAPHTYRNSEDSYDDCKDPSHPLYQYNYREALLRQSLARQIGIAGQCRARAGDSPAPVGHRIDGHIHTTKYIDLACTTVDSTRSALVMTVPYHLFLFVFHLDY